MKRILFVCLGNICRSPTAETIMAKVINQHGYTNYYHVDSCGTTDYHIGELADSRMRTAAQSRGYEITSTARQFNAEQDFHEFDYIVAMDEHNRDEIQRLDFNRAYQHKIHLMTDFCQQLNYPFVPDPYFGGIKGFDLVIDILEDACNGLLEELYHQDSPIAKEA